MLDKIAAVKSLSKAREHRLATLLFALIVCSNHKLGLDLSVGELTVLAGALGLYMGQGQWAMMGKLKTILGASDVAEDKK